MLKLMIIHTVNDGPITHGEKNAQKHMKHKDNSNTKKRTRQVQTFIKSCLRRIPKIYWPEAISNVEL